MAAAVRVGMARGSIDVRLRPVGRTSARPRVGAPAGPGATRRPASAASRPARSRTALRRIGASSPPIVAASCAIFASSGSVPYTCSPSRMLSSLMSQRWASSLATASRLGSSFTRPHSAASPPLQARSTISSSRWRRRRLSSPSAAAYSSMMASISASAPCSPAALSGGVRWPMVTAPSRRLACTASPGLLTMKG